MHVKKKLEKIHELKMMMFDVHLKVYIIYTDTIAYDRVVGDDCSTGGPVDH